MERNRNGRPEVEVEVERDLEAEERAREARSEETKRRWTDPAFRAKMTYERMKWTDERKREMSEKMAVVARRRWADPEARKVMLDSMRRLKA